MFVFFTNRKIKALTVLLEACWWVLGLWNETASHWKCDGAWKAAVDRACCRWFNWKEKQSAPRLLPQTQLDHETGRVKKKRSSSFCPALTRIRKPLKSYVAFPFVDFSEVKDVRGPRKTRGPARWGTHILKNHTSDQNVEDLVFKYSAKSSELIWLWPLIAKQKLIPGM